MEFDMKKDVKVKEEVIAMPSFLPRLFAAPSCLPKFSTILAAVADMKAQLVKKTMKLQEAAHNKEHEIMDKLDSECAWLRLEIEALEFEAMELRKELVERIYVEVRSVKEVKAVNELRLGTGAGAIPGMQCFKGTVYVSRNIPKDVKEAMAIAERLRQTF